MNNYNPYPPYIAPKAYPKIKGYITRDKVKDPFWGFGLILWSNKPIRGIDTWEGGNLLMHLPENIYEDIGWNDEPVEVELIIKKKENL